MTFTRRTDLGASIRLWLAATMIWRSTWEWGLVTRLALKYGVSRQFLYNNQEQALKAFDPSGPELQLGDGWIHKLILSIRMHCNGSNDGISRVLDEMNLGPNSVGHISTFLGDVSSSCPAQLPPTAKPVALLLDEIFTHGKPILVVLDAASHYILRIVLMPDRTADTWAKLMSELLEQGIQIVRVVKDQGGSMKAAAELLELPSCADLFHLHHPFDPFLASLERHAFGAIAHEDERLRIFENRKTEPRLQKSLEQYDAAREKTNRAIRDFDHYDYLHRCLHETFDSFGPDGSLRTRCIAQADVEAALELLEESFPIHQGIKKAVQFLRNNVGDYWIYFDSLEQIVRHQAQSIPEYVLRPACLAWQLAKKSVAVKSPPLKRKLHAQSGHLMNTAQAGAGQKFEAPVEALFDDLDENVRSSSALEAINSVIRNYLNACRGQTTQDTLHMLAFFLNHRKANRGTFAGTSPHERMTGQTETASPIELLMHKSSRRARWTQASSSNRMPACPFPNAA